MTNKTSAQPLPRITVVNIATGETREAAIEETPYGTSRLYWPDHLRKDGQPNLTRSCDGFLASTSTPGLNYYALYDAALHQDREAKASAIRDIIRQLKDQQAKAERQLLAIYAGVEADKGPDLL